MWKSQLALPHRWYLGYVSSRGRTSQNILDDHMIKEFNQVEVPAYPSLKMVFGHIPSKGTIRICFLYDIINNEVDHVEQLSSPSYKII